MRTALAILGAVVLVPLALGFVGGFATACSLPWLSRWLKRHEAKAARPTQSEALAIVQARLDELNRLFPPDPKRQRARPN